MHRVNKLPFSGTFETKLDSGGALLGLLRDNALVEVSTVATGAGIVLQGIVTEFTPEYAGPSTLSFTMEPYGVAPTINGTAVS
jgi:hypothetical protein